MAIYARKCLIEAITLFIVSLLSVPAIAEVSRTPWGLPDLNGVWQYAVATPLERADALGDKTHFTRDEAAAYIASGQSRVEDLAASFDGGKDKFVGLELWVPTDTPLTRDLRTSLIYEPADGKIPYTPAGLERLADSAHFDPPAGPEDRPLADRCIIGFNSGPPMDTTFEYNDNVQFFLTRDTVVIMNEMVNDARIVPLDGRAHLPEQIRQYRGDSRGYWEGDTLVVQTRNFTDETTFMGSGRNMVVTERFTLISDISLEYDFRVNDPEHFTTTWAARTQMRKSNFPIYEYACHEHNRSMEYMLSGARYQEEMSSGGEQ
jgi:hypothetical protein